MNTSLHGHSAPAAASRPPIVVPCTSTHISAAPSTVFTFPGLPHVLASAISARDAGLLQLSCCCAVAKHWTSITCCCTVDKFSSAAGTAAFLKPLLGHAAPTAAMGAASSLKSAAAGTRSTALQSQLPNDGPLRLQCLVPHRRQRCWRFFGVR